MSGAAADWRRFLTGRYAAFGTLAVSDAIAVALAGDGLAIPLVTTLGASPALATLIGLFPFVGGILQAFVPAILRRNHGDLRGLTIVIAAIGLMRPLLYIAVVVLIWAGLLSAIGGILLIAIGFGVGATAQALAGANVQTWFGRILPERERRFVAPRALAIQFGLGSVLLVPVALMVRVGEADWGVMIYAPAFVGALVASLAFIRAMRKLIPLIMSSDINVTEQALIDLEKLAKGEDLILKYVADLRHGTQKQAIEALNGLIGQIGGGTLASYRTKIDYQGDTPSDRVYNVLANNGPDIDIGMIKRSGLLPRLARAMGKSVSQASSDEIYNGLEKLGMFGSKSDSLRGDADKYYP